MHLEVLLRSVQTKGTTVFKENDADDEKEIRRERAEVEFLAG